MSTLREQTLEIVLKKFTSTGFNQSQAAKELGISRGTLRAMLTDRLGVENGYSKAVISQGLVGRS